MIANNGALLQYYMANKVAAFTLQNTRSIANIRLCMQGNNWSSTAHGVITSRYVEAHKREQAHAYVFTSLIWKFEASSFNDIFDVALSVFSMQSQDT